MAMNGVRGGIEVVAGRRKCDLFSERRIASGRGCHGILQVPCLTAIPHFAGT